MPLILEFTLSVLKELDSKGVSWGAVLTALLLWNKLMRNKDFKARDERVERNQRRIMEHWGIEGEWSTPRQTLTQTVLMNLRNWYYSLQAGIARVFQLRRERKMNKAWLVTLVTYILAQLAIRTGVSIPTEAANWIVDGLMLLIPIALAFMSKTKKPEVDPIVNTKPTNTFESNQ